MKNRFSCIVVALFVLAFVFANMQSASAASLPAPTVTSLSGDKEFKFVPVPIGEMLGTTTIANGILAPVGFGNGEKQFSGDGITLSGLEYGYVIVCFAFKGANQGWGGKVGYWDGKAWKLLDTTITKATESNIYWACAPVSLNGQYAFLQWVVDTSLLPKSHVSSTVPECDYSFTGLTYDFVSGPSFADGWVNGKISAIHMNSPYDLNGKTVKVTFIGSTPADSYLLNGSNGNLLIANGQMTFDSGRNDYRIPLLSTTDLQFSFYNSGITFLLDFGSCVKTVVVSLT